MARSSPQNELDRLMTEHLPSALRFATRLAGDVDLAEEIVQDALLRVARSWQSFRQEAEFRTWLSRIVINVFRDRLRAAPPTADPLSQEPPDVSSCDPAAAAQHRELGELIARRVSSLPPRQREVIVLTAFEGYSVSQVAALLEITEANVHSTLGIARGRLRTQLASYFADR